MVASAPLPAGAPAAALPEQSQATVFRQYYTDNDYFVSPEGILKILSALVCVSWSAVVLGARSCAGADAAALACGVLAALLYAGVVLHVPLYAPQAWLYTDIVLSTVVGVLLLVAAVLGMTVCGMNGPLDYIHGPLTIVTACMVTASAVLTYASAMRLWDAARAQPRVAAAGPMPPEQDV